jgi:CBS domain-containing protein
MGRHPAAVAGELMTAPPVTIGPDATVADAARVMSAHAIGRLPVVSRSGTLIGIISQGDLLAAFAEQDTADRPRQESMTL